MGQTEACRQLAAELGGCGMGLHPQHADYLFGLGQLNQKSAVSVAAGRQIPEAQHRCRSVEHFADWQR
jgi:hypothetical protein